LFVDEPKQWGLRGDPHLWREMKASLKEIAIPLSAEELTVIIEQQFEKLTGQPITTTEIIRIDRLNHGGMSGGCVSTIYWREKAIPLLLQRQSEL